jgi:hypothetical protein
LTLPLCGFKKSCMSRSGFFIIFYYLFKKRPHSHFRK